MLLYFMDAYKKQYYTQYAPGTDRQSTYNLYAGLCNTYLVYVYTFINVFEYLFFMTSRAKPLL